MLCKAWWYHNILILPFKNGFIIIIPMNLLCRNSSSNSWQNTDTPKFILVADAVGCSACWLYFIWFVAWDKCSLEMNRGAKYRSDVAQVLLCTKDSQYWINGAIISNALFKKIIATRKWWGIYSRIKPSKTWWWGCDFGIIIINKK